MHRGLAAAGTAAGDEPTEARIEMAERRERKGLGRGLSALLEDDADDLAAIDRKRSSREIPVEHLIPNRFQPRRQFSAEDLAGLADSIRLKGILVPILVRRDADDANRFEIIAGERRWRAAQIAQLHKVPVVVKEISDKESLEIAIIENVQRQDLNPIEEAEGYRRLMEEFGYTQADVATAVGKSRPHIANLLRLLALPRQVQDFLISGQLTMGHARALVTAEDPVTLAEEIIDGGMNVREVEKRAKDRRFNRPEKPTGAPARDPNIRAVEEQLSERLGLKVAIKYKGEKGELRIWFNSLEQFDDVLARLKRPAAVDLGD